MARFILDINSNNGNNEVKDLAEHIAKEFGKGIVSCKCIDNFNSLDQFPIEKNGE